MKSWWLIPLCLGSLTAVAAASPLRDQIEARDSEGKVYGVVVVCNDCKAPQEEKGKACHPGAADGWIDGKPCGSCLVNSNIGTLIHYPYDIQVTGKLVDKGGKPVDKRFVKMFLPNGWGVRAKTNDKGTFRLLLGATEPRKGKQKIDVDIGERVDSVSADDESFSMFLMPTDFKPCSGNEPAKPKAAKPPAKTR